MATLFYYGLKKRNSWFIVFLINSIVSSLLIYHFFSSGIQNYQRKVMSRFDFNKGDTAFSITIWKKTKEYDIAYSLEKGSSSSYLNGTYQQKGSELFLKDSSRSLVLKSNYLFGLGSANDSIKLISVDK
jgi:hypothetical protein